MESRRLQKEYEEIQKLNANPDAGISAQMVGNSMTHFKGTIQGPVTST